MSGSNDLSAVFFDFGGTLFSYRRVGGGTANLLVEAAGRLGIEADLPTAGVAYRQASKAAYLAVQEQPYYLHRDLFVDTFRRFAVELGADPSPEFLEWFHAAQRDLVTGQFELRKGCLETLTALRERGLNVAIVSNIDDDYLDPMVDRAGLGKLLDAWTSSEEARSCKPDSRIYELACEKADCTPARVLFVGDSPEQDIAGARRMGMRTALIREPGAVPPGHGVGPSESADHEIEELEEVLDLVHVQARG